MTYISPCNHPDSYLSGSTLESMIDKTKKMGLDYFACTDNGVLTAVLKCYSYGKKKNVKVIPGVEIFFKDDNCDIVKNTPSEQIKYFKLIIHAKDQSAYQKLVKHCSDSTKKKVSISEDSFPLFTWKDLEDICTENVTITTSNVECMVSKHLLVGRPDLALKYYTKIREMVGEGNFFPSIIPFKQDKYFNSFVKLKVGDKTVEIPANDRVITDSKFFKNHAKDLLRRGHNTLKSVFINKIKYDIKEEYQQIKSAKIFHDFTEFPGNEDIQNKANKLILALAIRFKDKVLINNYSYYSDLEDKVVQDMKLGENKRIYQNQYIASLSDITYYLKEDLGLSDEKIAEIVQNSHDWASNFKDLELKYNYKLPYSGENPEQQLINIIKKTGRMDWGNPVYMKQFKEEFELLTKNGVINLIPYFLPIVDIYDFYKENGYLTGPARGSAGGFLISYLAGITHIDPIKYGLSSSRFLTIDRVQQNVLPDIDFDVQSRIPLVGRDGNGGYLAQKYGDKYAQASTKTLLRIKSAILDANRFVKGSLEDEIQKLSKSLPNTPQGINDSDYIFGYENQDGEYIEGLLNKNEDLQKYVDERPEEWNIVKRALSLSRQNSRHASAYFISDEPIENTVPIMEVGGVKRVTQPEAKQCEEAGLIKYDFLVISVLNDINLCISKINKKNGVELPTGYLMHNGKSTYIWDLPEDQGVYDMLSSGETETVFQLNTTSVTPFVKKIKPKNIIDLATITSLVRPGPLDFIDEKTGRNMVEEYVERRYGRSKSDIPILNELLPETQSVLIFQEQVTKIAKELGGMNAIDSENVRIAMGKKKVKLLESLKPIFIEGAEKKVGKESAEKIWAMMATFAGYAFNKSHAVAYSVVSYACAFLKHNYKLEWWSSVLTYADNKEINEVFYKYVKDIILPPDINTSTEIMEVDYNKMTIRNKLSTINGLGEKLANKIIENRPYANIKDFVSKKACGDAMTKKLIHIGVLDSLFDKNMKLEQKMWEYEKVVAENNKENKIKNKEGKLKDILDEKEIIKLNKAVEKLKNQELDISIDEKYIGLSPKKDYLIKKSIFPTMNMDLQNVLNKDSRHRLVINRNGTFIMNKHLREQRVLSGEALQKIDMSPVTDDLYFCCAGYVIDCSEFTYSNGEKKALKLVIDSSGYISEKVLWADYNTGELTYDKDIKKGSICYFLYSKKVGKPYTNITEILLEEKSML